MRNLAPILLFTYNRLWHTQQTVTSLEKNDYAPDSELIIYSDGAKNELDIVKVQEVRNYLNQIKTFKKITVVEREKNYGLAKNIIDGVTEVVNKSGKIIVLEDDIVVNPNFLTFINNALDNYEDKKEVWHISGFSYPIGSKDLPDTYLWRFMTCWGWATWADRWKYFDNNPEKVYSEFTKEDIFRFNLDGTYDFWDQIVKNKNGKLDTWAIFWYSTIFRHNGLCLNPTQSLVENIGCDGSGCHCGRIHDISTTVLLNVSPNMFPSELVECKKCVESVKNYLRTYDVKNSATPHFGRIIEIVRNISEKVMKPQKPEVNPKDYSTIVGKGSIIPVQIEAYFLALNKYVDEGASVLDVGFGLGYGLNILAIKASEVSGVDVDEKVYHYCLDTIIGRNPRLISLKIYNGVSLPFPDDSFDILTCVDVIEHVEDYNNFIKEMLRVSRKGVFISTPNRRPEYTNEDGSPKNYWHLREWSFEEFDQIITKYGRVEWLFINGDYEGPFMISTKPEINSLALSPFIYKK